MLGLLLGALETALPLDPLEDGATEYGNDASEWDDDKNQFEDWLLRVEEDRALGPDVFY